MGLVAQARRKLIKMSIATIELAGARTLLVVPVLKGKELVGVIGIYRQEVRAFTARQIEVVQESLQEMLFLMAGRIFSSDRNDPRENLRDS
jgi:two-component system, NtrC family, sensor kinase